MDADEHMFDVLDVLEMRARAAGPSPASRAVRWVLARFGEPRLGELLFGEPRFRER